MMIIRKHFFCISHFVKISHCVAMKYTYQEQPRIDLPFICVYSLQNTFSLLVCNTQRIIPKDKSVKWNASVLEKKLVKKIIFIFW